MQQQKGFTLIELIIVIVILGILAVTAAPKFLDIQNDAKGATISAVEASLKSVNSIVYGKALIAGETAAAGTVAVNGSDYDLVNGYLAADQTTSGSNILNLLELDGEFAPSSTLGIDSAGSGSPAAGSIALTFYGFDDTSYDYSSSDAGCFILYTDAASGATPTITAKTDGCN
ncbi:prepilin-type N-terminal cleavage/methylation domain-containing protein [Flavobacterium sp. W21_SRS_FM6]|uniref:prepilin-type N-terminal cleavage/methylation domain-containing protein n=1 Tax=Flavobacterium sp. W21_SRS_FM6 TaxID=3240268 RepID=UPI003F93B823